MPARKKGVEGLKAEPEGVTPAPILPLPAPETPPVEKPILVAEAEPEPQAQPAPQPPPEPVKPQPESTTIPSTDIFGPLPSEPEKSSKKLFWIIISVFALLGVVAGGMGVYLQNQPQSTPTASPPSKPDQASPGTSSPPPEIQLNRQDLQIQILNGSGVTGAAKAAQDYLEGLGYTVSAVGNASSSSYTTTQISIKDAKQDYLTLLEKDLSGQYNLADTADSLEDSSKYDVVIVLGKE